MTRQNSKFLPLTRPRVAADRKIRCFRRKVETLNQDISLEKKTTEAMALSMYGVELLDNINYHLFACKIEEQQRPAFNTFKKSMLCHSFWKNPIPYFAR